MSYVVPTRFMVRADFKCYTASQLGMFSRYYRFVGSPTDPVDVSLADIGLALSNNYGTTLPPLLNAGATFSHIDLQAFAINLADAVNPIPYTDIYRREVGIDGSGVGDILPTQCSGIISLRTGLPDRNHRGRNYIPFPSESDSTVDGTPNAAYMLALQALATTMLDNIPIPAVSPTAVGEPVMLSKELSTIFTLYATIPEAKWATQRRRGSFGKPNTR